MEHAKKIHNSRSTLDTSYIVACCVYVSRVQSLKFSTFKRSFKRKKKKKKEKTTRNTHEYKYPKSQKRPRHISEGDGILW